MSDDRCDSGVMADELIEELHAEADAIGVGSGAPTARLLRRAAEQLAAQPMPASAEISEEPAGTLIANLIRLSNDANAEIVTLTMERNVARDALADVAAELKNAERELVKVCQFSTEANEPERMALLTVREVIARAAAAAVSDETGDPND